VTVRRVRGDGDRGKTTREEKVGRGVKVV